VTCEVLRLLGIQRTHSAISCAPQSGFHLSAERSEQQRNARDLEMINESADIMKQEAFDVLDDQVAS